MQGEPTQERLRGSGAEARRGVRMRCPSHSCFPRLAIPRKLHRRGRGGSGRTLRLQSSRT
eukprot:3453857-Pyramimonas_sp.AAC.1